MGLEDEEQGTGGGGGGGEAEMTKSLINQTSANKKVKAARFQVRQVLHCR